MSSINGVRQVGHGVGGGNASIDNIPFSLPGAWGGWTNDRYGFFADGTDGWVAAIHDHVTGQSWRAISDRTNPQFGAGWNTGYAGGDVWAAWLGSGKQDPQRGLFTSTGLHFPDAGLLGVGPRGELGFKPDYLSIGPSLVLAQEGQWRIAGAGGGPEAYAALAADLGAQGLLWQLSEGTAQDLCLLGGQPAIWREGQQIRVHGLPQPLQLGQAWWPRAYLIAGRWWLSYFSSVGGIILHPFDELKGVTIVPPGVSMWHSARSFGPEVVFALFPSEAEQNGWLLEPLTIINTETAPLKPLAPQTPALVLTKPARKMWAGWFEQAASPFGPGNAMLAVRNQAGRLDRPAIVGNESEHVVSGDILGKFIGGPSVETIEEAARISPLRPVAYWDARNWPRWPKLPAGSWLCLQLYQGKAESLEDLRFSARSMIASAPKAYKVVLVGQQYTSNANNVGYVDPSLPAPHSSEALKPLAETLVQLANESPNVIGLFLFSGYGRRGGLMDHPDLVAPWAEWAAALEAPALEPWPPLSPKPPGPPKPPPPPPGPMPGTFQPAIRMGASMATRVALRLGQYFASIDPNDKFTDGDMKGWYHVRFKKETKPTDAGAAFLLSQPKAGDLRWLCRPEGIPAGALSIDQTEFSGNIADAFSVKPNVSEQDWGGYEALEGWELPYPDGPVDILLVHYQRADGRYESSNVTVVAL